MVRAFVHSYVMSPRQGLQGPEGSRRRATEAELEEERQIREAHAMQRERGGGTEKERERVMR